MFSASVRAFDLIRLRILDGDSDSGDASLTLELSARDDVHSFLQRLQALQRIYSELCALFNVSEASNPLQISKIESGSFFAKLLGDSKVIEMMGIAVGAVARYLYRNFTIEGKISVIPRKVEALDELIGLKRRLTDALASLVVV